MSLKDRLNETQARIDRMKVKVNEAADAAKSVPAQQKAQIEEQLAALNASLDELDASIEGKINQTTSKVNASIDKVSASIDQTAASIQDKKDTLTGSINATKENLRLAREKSEGKLNAILLKAQMNVNATKAAIQEKKEAKDKAAQEKRIEKLLDYSDSCQELAVASAIEAEYAWLCAVDEVADYYEKYGE